MNETVSDSDAVRHTSVKAKAKKYQFLEKITLLISHDLDIDLKHKLNVG